MNIRDLHYLVTLSEVKHFGKAAEICHVSQPTLSMQLKKLEDTLNIQLIERSNKQVLLTPVGHKVVEFAKQILAGTESIKEIARISRDPQAGELRLGAFPTLAPYLFPLILPVIRAQFPKLELLLIEEKTDRLIAQLEAGEIDCALLALPEESPMLASQTVFEEPFMLATSPHNKLAGKHSVQLKDISDQQVLLLDEGHCLRAQSLELCDTIGMGEIRSYRATSLETLRNMVMIDAGVTFMPKLAATHMDNIRYIPFSAPVPGRIIALFWRKISSRQPLYHQLADNIATTCKPLL